MPILFNCTCGRKLQARDELAGKRLKCPGCHAILPVPERTVSEVSPSPPLARPALAGKSTSALPPLPELPSFPDEDDIAPPQARRLAASPINPWVDRSLDQQSTPWLGDDRERFNHGMKYRDMPEFLLIFLFLLLFGGLAAGAFYFSPDTEVKPVRTARENKITETGHVQGKVTYKGAPLPSGTIMFHLPPEPPWDDLIRPDGTYESVGLPPGSYQVTITTTEFKGMPKGFPMKGPPKLKGPPKGPPQFQGPGKGPMPEYKPPKYVPIPQRYTDPKTSGITIEVKKGKQNFNIELKD